VRKYKEQRLVLHLIWHKIFSKSEIKACIILQEGYTATELDRNKEVLILLGNIATGKTSLSKFLRNDPTLDILKHATNPWTFIDSEKKIGRRNRDAPNTIIPNVDVDEETETQVIDCAGFQDRISTDMELLDGFFNRKIFESSEKVKIVIVETWSSLRNLNNKQLASRLIQALTRTANVIGDNLESFKGSVGLIVTNVCGDINEDNLLTEIKDVLKNTKAHLG
jgi:hypothetical protein